MAKLAMLAAGAAAALWAQSATARDTEPAPPSKSASTLSGVTVTAPQKPSPLVSPESQFVRAHLPQGQSDQLPRFRDAICVSVVGLPPEFSAFIAKRIVEVANEVHAPVAKAADCTPNIHVIVSPQPQAQLDDIAKRRDILIGFHFTAQTKLVTTFNRPIQAWYVTRTRDTTGNSWIEIANPCSANITVDHGPCGDRPVGRAGSRLDNDMSAEVVHSLIIADATKVAGEKIDAVADYIAVLALAKWQRLERCNAIPSILNLMAEGCAENPPQAATPADLALLTGLYAVDPRELGSQQRMTIAGRMAAAKTPGAAAR